MEKITDFSSFIIQEIPNFTTALVHPLHVFGEND